MDVTPHEPAESIGPTDGEVRQWLLALHLSQFAGYVIPLAGFIAPIVIWRMKRDESPEVEEHGRMVANWLISYIAYWIAAFPLVLVLIGIPMMWLLGIVGILYPIIGAVKAADDKLWEYPGTIRFL